MSYPLIDLSNTCSCAIVGNYCYAHKRTATSKVEDFWKQYMELPKSGELTKAIKKDLYNFREDLSKFMLLSPPRASIDILTPPRSEGFPIVPPLNDRMVWKSLIGWKSLVVDNSSRVDITDLLIRKNLEPRHIFSLLCSWAACYCLLSRFSLLPKCITLTPILPRGVIGIALGCIAEVKGPETRTLLGGYQEDYLDKSGILLQLKGRGVQIASAPLLLTGKIRDLGCRLLPCCNS